MIAKIDLNLLLVLHTLVATRSVTQTALELGVSQPSVSRSLGQLRKILGDPLLIKTNRGMALTRRAEALREPLDRWRAATNAVLRDPVSNDPRGFKGKFRVATTDYGMLAVVTPAIRSIMTTAPDLQIEILPLLPDCFTQMASGAVDIVVTGYDPEPGRACERKLFAETLKCVVRPGHPLVTRRAATGSPIEAALDLEEYLAWPHFLANINTEDGDPGSRLLADMGLERRVAVRLPYFSSAPHLILESDAIMALPTRAASHFSTMFGLHAFDAPVELGAFNYWLLWHERARRDPALTWLVEELSACAAPPATDITRAA